MSVYFNVRGQQLKHVLIMGSYFVQKQQFKLNDGFVSYKLAVFHLTRYYLMDWSHVDNLWIIVMFLSVVWTAPIHRSVSIGEQAM